MRGLQIPLPGFDSRRRLQTGSSPRPAHPKAIQARMGHASITTTLDRYGHLYPA